MRTDFERQFREEHGAESEYDAVEIYGTYAKTTPESALYPAHTQSNPADVVHPLRPLNEISHDELIDIVSNGPSSKRSSKHPSPGHSHIATPNTSFKFEGLAATAQVRSSHESRTRQLEDENSRLTTKVKILEENACREREEWMNKYFDHLRDCKAKKPGSEVEKIRMELQKVKEINEKLIRDLQKNRSENASLRKDAEARERDWEHTVKELKRQLSSEKQKNHDDMVSIRLEFDRIQGELERVKARKVKEGDSRKLLEHDREMRALEQENAALKESLSVSVLQVEQLQKEMREVYAAHRESGGDTARRSLSTRRQAADRDSTPGRHAARLSATKKSRSGANSQSRSNKELKRSAKPEKSGLKLEDVNESIIRMEARINRHRERYLSSLSSQVRKEDLSRLSESLERENDQLSQLRVLHEELRRARR